MQDVEPAADGIIGDGSVLIAYDKVDRFSGVVKGLFSFNGTQRQTGVRRIGEFHEGKAPAVSVSGELGLIDSSTLSFEPFVSVKATSAPAISEWYIVSSEGLWGCVEWKQREWKSFGLFGPRSSDFLDSLRGIRFVIPLSYNSLDRLMYEVRKMHEKEVQNKRHL